MEVHTHTHPPGKKSTHYVWEFLMLFLAVFCGFLAENQREKLTDHRREKEFMRSMIDDLKKDTATISIHIKALEKFEKRIDSSIWLYAIQKNPTPAQVARIGRTAEGGLASIIALFTDRTSSQLKNSGGMRLIRNKTVADSLTDYWTGIDRIKEIIDRVESYRIDTRKLGSKIFGFKAGFYVHRVIDPGFLPDSARLLDNSPLLLGEYINNIVFINVIYKAEYSPMLGIMLKLAEHLIGLIKKEYHLESS